MDQSLFTNSKDPVVTSDRVLYTPSAFAKSSLMYLQEIGSLTARKEHTSRRTSLDSYLFFLVEAGSGKVFYDGIEYILKKGDCVFLDCSKLYSHTTSPEDFWTLKWIHFNGSGMPAIYEKYMSRGGGPVINAIGDDDIASIRDIYAGLTATIKRDDYVRDMRINEGIWSLLTVLMELAWNSDEKEIQGTKKDLLPVKMYLNEHFEEHISLDELASMFYINKFYLTRVFREQYGVSINTYLQQLRITKAKQLLRFTDMALEEIGIKCGIGEPNYFSRLFKKVEGISPSGYRMKWKDK